MEKALDEARAVGAVTPQLREAFGDPVVLAAHVRELAVVFPILVLMIAKPFQLLARQADRALQ